MSATSASVFAITHLPCLPSALTAFDYLALQNIVPIEFSDLMKLIALTFFTELHYVRNQVHFATIFGTFFVSILSLCPQIWHSKSSAIISPSVKFATLKSHLQMCRVFFLQTQHFLSSIPTNTIAIFLLLSVFKEHFSSFRQNIFAYSIGKN